MAKPVKPSDEDCCNSGCNPCIFDIYEKQLRQWKLEILSESVTPIFNQIKYTPFKLICIKKVTCDTNLYTFQAIDESNRDINSIIPFKMGEYAILKGNYVNLDGVDENISRPYTIINNDHLKKGSFQVLIKLYSDGKMSKYLRNIKEDCVLYWRGLYNHFTYKQTEFLLLLGAGTGIVPLYNIAYELTSNEDCETAISIIGCFKNLDNILLREELYELNKYWNCNVAYYLSSEERKNITFKDNVNFNKFNKDCLHKKLNLFKNKIALIIICGTELFNNDFKNACMENGILAENVLVF